MSTPTVTLFHGTDTLAAREIAIHGFVPPDVDALVTRVASSFNLTRDDLASSDSFVATRRADAAVYVTPNFMHAAGYALRSRELERDLYERAYWLASDQPYDPRDPKMLAWVRAHLPQQPIIAVLAVPEAELAPDVVADIQEHNQRYEHDWPLGYHLDVKLDAALASQSYFDTTPVDFCTCTPSWRAVSVYECEHESCLECQDLRASLDDDEPGDCIGMWNNLQGRMLTPAGLRARLASLTGRTHSLGDAMWSARDATTTSVQPEIAP